MSVDCQADGRFRYRTTAYFQDGTPYRISGTAPKHENTRAAAIRCEAEHVAWLATQPRPPHGDKPKGWSPHPSLRSAMTEALSGAPASLLAPPPSAPVKPTVPTLAEFVDTYLATSRLDNAFSTVEAKEDHLQLYIVPVLGDRPLDQIDAVAIEAFRVQLSKMRNRKIKCRIELLRGKTINNILGTLRNLLDTARRFGHVAFVPEVTRAKEDAPEFDFLTFDELDTLIAAADGVWQHMIIVAGRTGVRRGELLGIRQHKDIDTRSEQLHVRETIVRGRVKPPKNGKPRSIPMSGQAQRALLAARHDRGERLFCDAWGKPFTQGVMASQLERICRNAGLRVIGWHVLRHTFASHLVMRGVHIKTVQELMGHSSLKVTMRYAHLAPHILHDSVRLLDGVDDHAPAAEPMTNAPAPTLGLPTPRPMIPAPQALAPRAKTSREIRAERLATRANARVVARNRQESASVPPLN